MSEAGSEDLIYMLSPGVGCRTLILDSKPVENFDAKKKQKKN